MTTRRRVSCAYGVCARLALAIVVSSGAAACGNSTKASSYSRDCENFGHGGFLTPNARWQSSPPWHVDISAATARSIAKRVGPSEFQPPGSHPYAKTIPCSVASDVAFEGARAWSVRQATDDWITVDWTGYTYGPSLGRFHCRASRHRLNRVMETCIHKANHNAGEMAVTFTVRPFHASE
jgi:hypothetical protein